MLFPSICAVWTTPMLFPSICAVWTTPMLFFSICAVWTTPRRCSFLSVPSGPLLDAVLFYLFRLNHSSTLFPSICAVWTTPMLFPSICAVWTTPMLFPSICAVWTTPRRCSLPSVPSGQLWCCSLYVDSSICAVWTTLMLFVVCRLFYLCRLYNFDWCCSLPEKCWMLTEVQSFVKNSYTRKMGLKFGKLPRKSG